jgi:hypothetical protein
MQGIHPPKDMDADAIHSFLKTADPSAIASLRPEVKKRVHDYCFDDPLSDSEQGTKPPK